MIKQYLDKMVSTYEAEVPTRSDVRKNFSMEVLRLGQRLYSDEHPMAWCGVLAPYDLLNAMGVTACFVEVVGGMLASSGAARPFFEASEEAGFSADLCGWHRAVIGATLKGMMPKPNLVIATNSVCSTGVSTLELQARSFHSPLFMIHVPASETEENVHYLARQFREMTRFVAEHTGRALDEDRLRHAMAKTNEARRLGVELFDLARRVPSPGNGTDLKNLGLLLPLFLGTQTGVDILEAYRNEFSSRCEREESGVPGERLRLMWLQEAIQFKHPLIEMLRDEYRAAIVVEELNDIYWAPIEVEDPYVSLALRAIAHPFNGYGSNRLQHIVKLAQAYKVDGAINPCHWGCRQGSGSRGLVEAALKEIGVPVVNLEVDCADSRNFAEGQLRTRLEAFVEVLENRRARNK